MARWFVLPGWPARVLGHSAAVPIPARPPGSAVHYKTGIHGYPGTRPIPVVPVIPSPDIGDVAQMAISRSSDAPNAFYPNMYWARPNPYYQPGAGMPVSVYSDNMMPVPATDPRSVNAPLQVPLDSRRVQGFTGGQVRWPANLIQWPTINQGG